MVISVRVPESAFTSPVRTEWYFRDVLYAVLYVRVSCFVVRVCGVSRRYIDVCYCDIFSVVKYIAHHHRRVIKLSFSIVLCIAFLHH